MKSYPKYKPSGVDFLGGIPESWDLHKLKLLTNHISIPAFKKEDDEIYIALENIESWTGKIIHSEEFSGFDSTARKFTENDILFGKLRPYLAKVVIPDFKGVCVSEIIVLRPIKLKRKYLFFILLNPNFIDFVSQTAEGTKMPRTSWNKICDLKFPVPPLSEQQQIADFLDYKTEECDRFIANRQKQIELLNEQKASIINKAVTKGINPNVKMKPSGVNWIEEIPENWIFTKLKFLTNQIVDGTHFTPEYLDDGIPFLRVTDIKGSCFDLSNIKKISYKEHKELSKRCKPEKGDLLLSKNGTIGRTIIVDWDYEFSIFVSLCLIKFKKDFLAKFANYVFKSNLFDQQINDNAKAVTIQNLHLEKIKEFEIVFPPLSEQQQIIDFLDYKMEQCDHVISKYQKQIDLMQEYRTALISQAVTGKIDVREWKPKASSHPK